MTSVGYVWDTSGMTMESVDELRWSPVGSSVTSVG